MRIYLNGSSKDVGDAATVAALVAAEGLVGRRIAVELNGEIVSRSRHGDVVLQEDDRVEIVQAIGGG